MTGEERELRPAGRYEWEQIIRRARLAAVIPARRGKGGKTTKGGMSGNTFTGIALGWASYANDRGQDVWPGDATVAVDLETSIDAVRKVRKALLDLGLLEFVRHRTGNRGTEYRLTLPTDLLDVLEVLTPAQHKLAANHLRDRARGKLGWSSGLPGGPGSGGPVDYPSDPEAAEPGWSSGHPENGSGWSSGHPLGGPVDTHTDQDRTSSTSTDHSETDLRTAVTVAREAGAATDSDSDVVADRTPAGPPLPERCPHSLVSRRRADGKPSCALCRVGAPASRPGEHLARVIPLNRTQEAS